MREWWGEPDEELGFIRDMVEGRDTTRPFIIEKGGEPIGYIQYWFIGHHQNRSGSRAHPWLADLPPDAVGWISPSGDASRLSKGDRLGGAGGLHPPAAQAGLPDHRHRPRPGQRAGRARLCQGRVPAGAPP